MLSQSVVYAVTALGHLAASAGKSVSVKDIAEACGTPVAFLAKILHSLVRKRLLVSRRGIGGGMALARDAGSISLRDICIALDDPIVQPQCMLGLAECSQNRSCPAHGFCKPNREQLVEFLNKTTVADIAAFQQRRRQNTTNG